MRAEKQATDGSKKAEGYKVGVENSVAHVNQLDSNASLFSRTTSKRLTRAHTMSVCHKLSDVTHCCYNG